MKFSTDTNVLVRRIDEETVLVNVETNRILHTNATGSRIWELMTEGSTYSDIVQRLSEEYQQPQEDIEGSVRAFVDQVLEEGLVTQAGLAE